MVGGQEVCREHSRQYVAVTCAPHYGNSAALPLTTKFPLNRLLWQILITATAMPNLMPKSVEPQVKSCEEAVSWVETLRPVVPVIFSEPSADASQGFHIHSQSSQSRSA